MYPPFPPVILLSTTQAVPFDNPKQVTSVFPESPITSKFGSIILSTAESLQFLLSLTNTLYCPKSSPFAVSVV